MIRFVYLR